MRADLKSLRNGQSPDCRRLVDGDGEFLFWPTAGADFSPYRNSPEDYALLQAMVPGEYGKWWFDETPWFIPSLRRVILENTDVQRASAESSAIDRGTLLRVAEAAVRQMEKTDDPLTKLRVKQFNVLTGQDDPRKFREEVSKLADELTKLRAGPTSMELDATDVHLLGVLEHFLSMSETNTAATAQSGSGNHASRGEAAYAEALDMYETAEAKSVALAALCHCDLGNLLLLKNRDWTRAAREFESSLSPFCRDAETAMAPAEERTTTRSAAGNSGAVQTRETPAAFQIYAYCQQADAWQRQNRWGEADRCLDSALAVAQDFAPDHSLTSFVHARRAWSAMEQWQIRRAAESFSASNRVLANLARDTNKVEAADVKPALDTIRSAEFADLLRYDYDAAINYLHNEHGLAMTQRFEGHVKESAATYRAIIDKLSLALRKITSLRSATNAELSTDVEARLLDRLVNTQERLGDCNLFGDPDLRDIKEAADDYRRAIDLCSGLAADRRDLRKASLLYRQALALAIPSAIQDPEHARFLCDEAEALLKQEQGQKSSALVTLSVLSPALVNVFESGSALESLATTERLAALRTAIADANAKGGRSLHRDQLEVLLFAARELVDQGEGVDRFQAARDGDLLLSLCRQTLVRGQTPDSSASPDGAETVRGESLRYLRPYYDAVMRRKLALTPKHVKELLEVQFEATEGELYVKPQEAHPILAVYVLDGKGWMFLDIPRGVSKHVTLDGHCLVTDLRTACEASERKLRLPADIFKELAGLAGSPGAPNESSTDTTAFVDCRWHDHVRGLTGSAGAIAAAENPASTVPALVSSPVTTVLVNPAPVRGAFPFVLPNGVTPAPSAR